MKGYLLSLAACFASVVFYPCCAEDLRQQRMIQDLEFVSSVLENNYALAQWKQEKFGWSLQTSLADAKEALIGLSNPSVKQFQRLVKSFLKSTRDYHVEVVFYSTEMARLPFNVEKIGEKYFISTIDPDKSSALSFAVGDELLQFNGFPIEDVVQQFLQAGNHGGKEESDRALAQTFLTERHAFYGHEVPQGKVSLCTRTHGSSTDTMHELEWECYPEYVAEPPSIKETWKSALKDAFMEPAARLSGCSYFQKVSMLPGFERMVDAGEEVPTSLGNKTSFLPPLGLKKWEADAGSAFQAYIFEHKGRNIGFLRIPTYYVEDSDQAVAQFAKIIQRMQRQTDCLIIDQMSNPGGNLLYLYALVSMLSDKPLGVPKHRIALTQEDLYFAFTDGVEIAAVKTDKEAQELLGPTLQGIPVNRALAQGIVQHLQFLVDEWEAGRELTEPTYLLGIGPIAPYPDVRYTKPLLVLINRLDFSGGDFFAAILQDNKRALLMGTPTAGAGGYVKKVTFPNLNGIAYFSYTVSMAERMDNQPIENLGITPDIYCEVTENDLHSNYQEFSQAVLNVVDTLCEESKLPGLSAKKNRYFEHNRRRHWKSRSSMR